jgi:hypothetical protein
MSEDPYRIDCGREGSSRGQNQTLIPAAASRCTTYQPPFWRLKLLPYELSLENFVPHPWLEFAATSQSVDVAVLRTVAQNFGELIQELVLYPFWFFGSAMEQADDVCRVAALLLLRFTPTKDNEDWD